MPNTLHMSFTKIFLPSSVLIPKKKRKLVKYVKSVKQKVNLERN